MSRRETLSAPEDDLDAARGPSVSVVVTLFDEAGTLEELHRRLTAALESLDRPYEALYVDDGSTDGSFAILERLHADDPHVRAVRLKRNAGQHPAMHAGLSRARGEIVVTMDGDLQNLPEDVPRLVEAVEAVFAVSVTMLITATSCSPSASGAKRRAAAAAGRRRRDRCAARPAASIANGSARREGDVNADIRPKVDGYLLRRDYKEGSFVRQGQLLFEIDPRQAPGAAAAGAGRTSSRPRRRSRRRSATSRASSRSRRREGASASRSSTTRARRRARRGRPSARCAGGRRSGAAEPAWTRVTSPISGIAGIAQAAGRRSRQPAHRAHHRLHGRSDPRAVSDERAGVPAVTARPGDAERGAPARPRGRHRISAQGTHRALRPRRRHQDRHDHRPSASSRIPAISSVPASTRKCAP